MWLHSITFIFDITISVYMLASIWVPHRYFLPMKHGYGTDTLMPMII